MPESVVLLPLWHDTNAKKERCEELTKLEYFIWANEPSDNADQWRLELSNALAEELEFSAKVITGAI